MLSNHGLVSCRAIVQVRLWVSILGSCRPVFYRFSDSEPAPNSVVAHKRLRASLGSKLEGKIHLAGATNEQGASGGQLTV